MRALVVCQFYESAHGGGIVVARLLRRLLQERGHQVDVLCLAGGDDPQPGTVLRLRPLPFPTRNLARQFLVFLNNRAFDGWFIRQLDRIPWRAEAYDFVHCQDFLSVRLARAVAARWRAAWGVTLHEFLPRQMALTVPGRRLGQFFGAACQARDRALRPDYQSAAWLAGVSRAVAESTQRFVGPSYRHVRAVYNAFTPRFVAGPADDPRPVGRPVRFLYVGRLSPEKGIDALLEAFSQRGGQDTLTVIGLDGALRSQVERVAAREPRIHLKGAVPYEQMAEQYLAHDVVCCPARWEEPFGLTTLEARAGRRGVLGTRRGGIPEILEGYPRAVILNTPEESPGRFIAALRTGLDESAAACRAPLDAEEETRFMARFSPETFAAAYERLYDVRVWE